MGYIEIGILDDKLIKFANDLSSKITRENENYNEGDFKQKLEDCLFKIKKLNSNLETKNGKKRFLKLIFLIFDHISSDDYIDFEMLNLLNNKISIYNSKKLWKSNEEFIEELINEELIIEEEEFYYFEELDKIFHGQQKYTKNTKEVLEFELKKY